MLLLPIKFGGKQPTRPITLCVLNKHEPDRRAAKWDGTHYVGHCLKCGRRIRRKAHKDWRRDWLWARNARNTKRPAAS